MNKANAHPNDPRFGPCPVCGSTDIEVEWIDVDFGGQFMDKVPGPIRCLECERRLAATITVYECESCECRGDSPETVRHLVTCTDQSRIRPLTFELGSADRPPSFGG